MNAQEIMAANARAAQLLDGGKLREAEELCRRILAQSPDDPQALHNLGIIALRSGHLEESVDLLSRAVASAPNVPQLRLSLSLPLIQLGRREQARQHLTEAIRLNPSFAPAHTNLGVLLTQERQWDEAQDAFRRAMELQPGNAVALCNLALATRQRGRLDEAIELYRQAIAADPKSAEVYNALGSALREAGRISEAVAEFRIATELAPASNEIASNFLYALYFDPQTSPEQILRDHQLWAARAARGKGDVPLLKRGTSPFPSTSGVPLPRSMHAGGQRLRIGYVSPDLRHHVVGFFMEPILEHHDRKAFAIHCYTDVAEPDEVRGRLRSHADTWRDTARLTDQQLAQQICDDGIDILVDLTLHMRGNRLGVFAMKPAPVQITHLDYCGTSGLSQMDWCMSDWEMSPPGLNEQFFTEELLRLPDSYWCYRPSLTGPAVGALPAFESGYITFGSLNSCAKVNDRAIAVWSTILSRVPEARLAVHAMGGEINPSIRQRFVNAGIASDRLSLHDMLPRDQYLALYNSIDIALDTFPYAGGTTSLDALWMGVPVVSLVGTMPTARTGLTLLKQVELQQLAVQSVEEYVEKAVGLSRDFDALSALRSELRQRLKRSPAMDEERYTRNLEAAYRSAWEQQR